MRASLLSWRVGRGFRLLASVATAALALLPVALYAQGQTSPIPAGPVQSQAQLPDYKIGYLDEITVTTIRHPEFSGDFLVPNDGIIEFPGVGKTMVLNLTTAEVRNLIVTALKERLRSPEVSVTIKTARPQKVIVAGDIKAAGPYEAKPGWRISEYVSVAGGVPGALQPSDCRVTLTRANGDQVTVSLADALQDRNGADLKVDSGDTIVVSSLETITIFVMGKVVSPGAYVVRKDRGGILQALTLAGGVKDDASLSKVRLIRQNQPDVTIDLGPALNFGQPLETNIQIESGDIVMVPELQSKFAILGYANKPGFFPLPDGKVVTLADALSMAGGVNATGRASRVSLVRTEDGKETRKVYDIGKFWNEADGTQNPEIKPGDVIYVPETNKLSLTAIAPGISLAALLYRIFGR